MTMHLLGCNLIEPYWNRNSMYSYATQKKLPPKLFEVRRHNDALFYSIVNKEHKIVSLLGPYVKRNPPPVAELE